MTNRWVILLAGDIRPTERLRAQVRGARVIAADAGIRHAEPLAVEPELWVGDFDSAGQALSRRFAHVARETHPREKDFTDGALAISRALEEGARELLLVGALGGRSDHALLHLAQLADLAGRGLKAFASTGAEEAYGLAAGRHDIDLPAGTTFSIIGFGELENVSLGGARWPLREENLPFAHSRPLSNIAHGSLAISIGRGRGVLLASLKPGS